jgi:hypothetical protein
MEDELKTYESDWKINDSCTMYDLEKLQLAYEMIPLNDSSWMLWDKDKDPGSIKVKFALFRRCSSDMDGKNITLTLCMHGYGFLGGLNECRHTYWGEDGYIFYPNAKDIKAALDFLSQHFDMD